MLAIQQFQCQCVRVAACNIALGVVWSGLADLVDPGIRRSGYHTAETTTLKMRTVTVETTRSRSTRVMVPAERHLTRFLTYAMACISGRPFFFCFSLHFILSAPISSLLSHFPFLPSLFLLSYLLFYLLFLLLFSSCLLYSSFYFPPCF